MNTTSTVFILTLQFDFSVIYIFPLPCLPYFICGGHHDTIIRSNEFWEGNQDNYTPSSMNTEGKKDKKIRLKSFVSFLSVMLDNSFHFIREKNVLEFVSTSTLSLIYMQKKRRLILLPVSVLIPLLSLFLPLLPLCFVSLSLPLLESLLKQHAKYGCFTLSCELMSLDDCALLPWVTSGAQEKESGSQVKGSYKKRREREKTRDEEQKEKRRKKMHMRLTEKKAQDLLSSDDSNQK